MQGKREMSRPTTGLQAWPWQAAVGQGACQAPDQEEEKRGGGEEK